MNVNIFAVIFLTVWSGGVLSYFVIKNRIKKLYPALHSELYASSIAEHNIAISLKYQGFSLNSSRWKEIEDKTLITYLQIQRALFIIMILLMISFASLCFRNGMTGYK